MREEHEQPIGEVEAKPITWNWKGEELPFAEGERRHKEEFKKNYIYPKRGFLIPKKVQEQIRISLRKNGNNISQTSRECEVAQGTVKRILREMPDQYEQRRNERAEAIIDDLWDVTHVVINSITPEDIKKASLKDKAITVSVLAEKAQLLSGDPTEIIQNNASDRELIILARKAGIALPANVQERIKRVAPEIADGEIIREEVSQLPEEKQT